MEKRGEVICGYLRLEIGSLAYLRLEIRFLSYKKRFSFVPKLVLLQSVVPGIRDWR